MTEQENPFRLASEEALNLWAFTRRTRQLVHRLAYGILLVFIAVITTLGFNLWYTKSIDMDSNRQWCDLLTLLDNPIPPDSDNPRSVDIAVRIHTLRVNFGC